ncbi:bacteriohopanetetrol glucosamine biosynthesis glycosyltransferase HpnI [Hephaestia mangrovi]|uniref:bacteriohopanetetrol glucosamine biosynthesis glycosyltransferase HpnI n=1 Tax=Hephaestia mangrovi TaxID=2873268 RepID=UPI001CA717B3|nr:bacteriohopanetetrol glucosamine biosynthesis glycosyltransferase HpnI [Hephaestia mangrovi]MBY8828118.1 bacteriohopanetetrol glucosamine biosynthesis glycosyltransferase HpnI [Hephaestia mangrovi]
MVLSTLGWMVLAVALAGCGYTLAAAWTLPRFFATSSLALGRREAVTLLKPLHGAEPRLAENLASFLDQAHEGPIQLLCGVQRADDPAIAAVEALRSHLPAARIDLVVDDTLHGASGKVANLINMSRHIAHPIVVMSDSDIAVAPDYLARVLGALDRPGVGAVSCLYRGRGDAGWWSRFGAMGLSYQFLPGAVFGVARGLGRPCMGSTIAFTGETLRAIGGFEALADVLADDYAIGEAVAALGLEVAIPPMLVTHASDDATLGALWRHELRWGATVRAVVPAAYALSAIALPLPFGLLGTIVHPAAGLAVVALTLALRALLAGRVDRIAGTRGSVLLLPLRDLFSFAVFVASLFARSVEWRGRALTMEAGGRVSAK